MLLSNEKEKSIEFIDGYISDENRPLKIFIENLFKNWSGFWDYISKSNLLKDKKDHYLSLIIRYAKIEDISLLPSNNSLTTTIIQKPNFLSLVNNNAEVNYFEKIVKIIEQLNISFEKLEDPNNETNELFEYVYKNKYYQINKSNLQQIIKLYGNSEAKDTFEISNYTSILQSDCTALIEYINYKINIYVEHVYLKLEQNKSDNEVIILKLLKNEELNDKLKIKIIQKVETVITDLCEIEELEVKQELLISNKVAPTWSNIIDYYIYCDNKIDENLVQFLNFKNVYSDLSKEKMPYKDETTDYSTFRLNLLKCDNISDESYLEIFSNSIFPRASFDYIELSKIKINYLADKILTTTKLNYNFLRINFNPTHIKFIEKDFEKFLENLNDFETGENDILLILKSDTINNTNKFNYISLLNEEIIVDNKQISKKVSEIILEKSTKIAFEFNTLDSIIKNSNSIADKIKLINLYFESLSNDILVMLITSVNWDYKELFVKQHRPKFDDNPYNRELLGKLKSKKLITSFDIYGKDNTKIQAVANY